VTSVKHYRLLTLTFVVAGSLLLFLGFFFVWMIAPVVGIAVFYLIFFFNEERGGVGKSRRQARRVRRQVLAHEASARRADLTRST